MDSASAIFGQSTHFNSRTHCSPYDVSVTPHAALAWVTHARNCFGVVSSGHSGFATLYAGPLRSATSLGLLNYTAAWLSVRGDNDLVPFNWRLNDLSMGLGQPMLLDPRFRPSYVWGEKSLRIVGSGRRNASG